jgi:hypothetical protein
MEEYWNDCPHVPVAANSQPAAGTPLNIDSDDEINREYAQFQEMCASDGVEEGWAAELRRYLSNMPRDATKDMDVVQYWQVRISLSTQVLLITRLYPDQPSHLSHSGTNRP